MAPLSPNSGIPAVLKQLSDSQNSIGGVESKVLSLKGEVDRIDSPHFVYLGSEPFATFLESYRPDIAIIHSFFHVEYVQVVRDLVKNNIPFFVEPHGSFGHQAMKKSRVKKTIANATIFRQQIKASVGYIFTNYAEQADSVYRTEHDLVIPNGVLPSVVNSSKGKNEETIGNPIIYFLGRYDINHKGLDYLFGALDLLEKRQANIKVRLYGTGSEEQLQYVNERIKNYKKMDVSNCGTIYGEDKKKALEACNILILTSRYEGSPMTILDGFSYGNPCIVTPGTNVAEEVNAHRLGWVTKLEVDEIAECIEKAIQEYRDNALKYYNNCKQYVMDNYTWDKVAQCSVDEISAFLKDK